MREMRGRSLLLLGSVLLLLGVWSLTRSGESGRGLRPAFPPPPEGSDPPPALSPPVEAVGGASVAPVFTPLQTDSATAPRRDGERERPAVLPPRLVGRVVDSNQRPVSGAEVYAASGVARDDWPLDAPAWKTREQEIRFATTDEYGAFRVTGLRPGPIRLSVRRAGFALFERHDVPLASGGETDVGELTLRRGAQLRGRLSAADGRPISGAVLTFLRPETSLSFASSRTGAPVGHTQRDGSFEIRELEPGPFVLAVEAPGQAPFRIEGVLRDTNEPLDLGHRRLPAPAWITGSAQPIRPGRLGDLVVHAMPTRAAQYVRRPDGTRGRRSLDVEGALEQRLQADGSFTLDHLLPDTSYTLRLLDEGDPLRVRDVWSEPLLVESGAEDITLRAHPSVRTAFDLVNGATGEQVLEFEHEWLGARSLPRAGTDFLRATTDEERATLVVRALGFAPHVGDPQPILPTPLLSPPVIALQPAEPLRIVVKDRERGTPVADARVVVLGADDGARREVRTDEDGVALAPGPGEPVRLGVLAQGYAPWLGDASGNTETIELDRGGSAAVRVLDSDGAPVRGALVRRSTTDPELARLERGAARAVTDLSGTARFEDVAPGRHRFEVARPEPQPLVEPPLRSVLDELPIPGTRRDDDDTEHAVAADDPLLPSEWSLAEVRAGELSSFTLGSDLLGTLAGRITERGAALVGAVLRLYPETDDFYADTRDPLAVARTDGTGRFTLENLFTGRYVVSIEHTTRVQASLHEVVVTPWTSPFEVDLDVATLHGLVAAEDGTPVAGANVFLPSSWKRARRDGRSDGAGDHNLFTWDERHSPPVVTTTDERGQFVLRGVDRTRALRIGAVSRRGFRGSVHFRRVTNALLGSEVEVRLNATSRLSVEGFHAQFPELSNRALGAAWRFGEHFDSALRFAHPHPRARHDFDGLTADWWIVFQVEIDGWGELSRLRVLENALMQPVGDTVVELFR